MAQITLPSPGDKPWNLNPAITAINDELTPIAEAVSTGRLSPEGLAGELADIAAELNPEALSDTFIAEQIASPGSATATQLSTTIGEAVASVKNRLVLRDIPATSPVPLRFVQESPGTADPIVMRNGVTWGVLTGPDNIIGAPLINSGELDGGYFRNTLGMTDSDANRAPYQLEWVADDERELRFRAFTASPRFLLFIDDVPAQFEPQQLNGFTVAAGGNFRVVVPHPAPGRLTRFRLQIAQAGLRATYTEKKTNIYAPNVQRPRIGILGTSFEAFSGSTALFLDSWVYRLGEMFGADIINCARSGAGYVSDGTNTFAAQIPPMLSQKPDLIVSAGSGNDVAVSGTAIQAAAEQVFATLGATGIPVIASGMLPRGNSGETAGPAGKVIQFTKAAADAAPNVLGFIDPIGTVDPLPDYTSGAAYAIGAKVRHLGTTWQARVAISSAPATFDRSKWFALSWNLGTGRVGAETGDGNRDVTVQADDLHPTARGSRMIAENIGPRIAQIIKEA